MLKLKRISDIYGIRVFTESGNFFGIVEEVIITHSKIHSWRIVPTKESILSRLLDNVKGIIVPHNLVKAVGDIIIANDAVLPSNTQKEDYLDE